MPRSSLVFNLLLLALIVGDLALITVNLESLGDFEAVAEWRIDKDMDEGAGPDPHMPASPGLFREPAVFAAERLLLPGKTGFVAVMCMSTQATRAPPLTALA